MTPARFRWGIILIQIGGLILLRNAGVLNDNLWVDLLVLSPIVLIAIGLEKIFTKSRAQFISYLTSVGLFFGGFLIAFYGSYGGDTTSFFSETIYRKGSDPNVKSISATLRLDDTDLTIRDSGRDLVYGRFDRFTRKPKIDESLDAEELQVRLVSRYGSFLGGVIDIDTDSPQDWYLKFSEDVPLELDCYGDNADIHLNLSTTPLKRLRLDTEDATIYLKLGVLEDFVTITVAGGNSDLRLRVPASTGLKVVGDDYGSYLTRLGFGKVTDGFTSEGYDTLTPKYEIDLDEDLSSFSLDFF